MRIIDNILFIEFAEMELCDVPRRTILSWDNVKDPADRRKVLIRYDKLSDKYKNALIKRYGDPRNYANKEVIKFYLRTDTAAIDFFSRYRYDGDTPLPDDKIKDYCVSASWLNLIIELTTTIQGKKLLKDSGLQGSKFWSFICSKTEYEKDRDFNGKKIVREHRSGFLELEKVDLPYDYQSILRKINSYQSLRHECIVSKKFGNTNSKKVKDEENHALLIEMISHPAQYDDTFICIKYNKVAEQFGFKTITPVTVGNYRHKNAVIINGYRKGKGSWYDEAGKTIHTNRPSAPLLLINSDDNELDLYFQQVKVNKKGHNVVNYYYRPCLYVVIDAFNDLILGYAIGDSNTQDLVKAAYLNAANYVKRMTGARHFWHEIKTDRWGIDPKKKNDFSQWFSDQAEFTPTQLGNSRGKVIEQSFRGHWSSKLRELFPKNYSGTNITSKKKLNRDYVESNKHNFPTIDEVSRDVENFINAMRQIEVKGTGKTREQVWLDAFDTMQDKHKRIISDEQHFTLLGHTHFNSYSGKLESNTITKNGLMPTINGDQYIFEIPKNRFLDTIGKEVYIKYDPYDMSQILAISKDEKTKLVCNQYERMPMAKADYLPDTPEKLNNRIGEKVSHPKQIAAGKELRQATLQRMRMDAEGALQAGVIVKELKRAATQIADGDYSSYEDVEEVLSEDIDIRDLM